MRALRIIVAVVLTVWLQMALRNVLVLGTAPLDLVLVAVVYIALRSGPTTGLLAGACAGLAQDALGSGIYTPTTTALGGRRWRLDLLR